MKFIDKVAPWICLLAMTFVAVLLLTQTALPQAMCVSHTVAVKQLTGKHKEHRVLIGVTSRGELMEVFAHPTSRKWTILITHPRTNMSCMTAGYGLDTLAVRKGIDG
jgi:hypothetical protein